MPGWVFSSSNMWLRRVETQTRVSMADSGRRINAKNISELGPGTPPKVPWPAILGPELGLETFPGDQRGIPWMAHPL